MMESPVTETGETSLYWRLMRIHAIYRTWRWLRMPLACKRGHHLWDENNWGYGFGQMDWYCGRCGKLFAVTHLDDLAESDYERVQVAKRILGLG